MHDRFDRDADQLLGGPCQPGGCAGAGRFHRRAGSRHQFAMHPQGVEMAVPIELELVVGSEFRNPDQNLLDLGREHVDAADDQHVIGAAGDLLHAAHRARGTGQQPRQVSGAIADHRKGLLGERGEDKLAELAVGHDVAGLRVDDLRVKMVLPDVQPVLGLDAFVGHARSDHLREPVDVHRVQVAPRLDLAAHLVGPRLGPEDADLQAGVGRVEPLRRHLVEDVEEIGWRHHDHPGGEVLDELDLAGGHAAGYGNDRAAQPLATVMGPEPAGKQAVAVGHVHDVTRSGAGGAHGTGHAVGPHGDVVGGVAHHRRLAGGTGRGVDAHELFARHREHAKGIVAAQVVLGGEREVAEIVEPLEVAGVDALGVEGLAVMRHVVVGVPQRPFQALKLQRLDFVAAGDLDGIEARPIRAKTLSRPHRHGGPPR